MDDNRFSRDISEAYQKALLKHLKKSASYDPNFNIGLGFIYEQPEYFLKSFYDFSSNINSLLRYFEYTFRYIEEYLDAAKNSLKEFDGQDFGDGMAVHMMHSEDEDWFKKHHLMSILSSLFVLLEKLFDDVAHEVAETIGVEVELTDKQMPYIERYIQFLNATCSLNLKFNKETNRKLNAIRRVRNKYVHELGENISAEISSELTKLLQEAKRTSFDLDRDFIELSFSTIREIAKRLEDSCIQFYRQKGVIKE